MGAGGFLMKSAGTVLRILQFLLSVIIVGIFAYFVSNLRQHHVGVADAWGAVLGISSAAAVYTLFGIVFTICLGSNILFGNLAIVLDLAFFGAFIYVSWATRAGSDSCRGFVYTPLGNGDSRSGTGLTVVRSLHRACQLNKVCFAVAIILTIFFFFSAVWQFMIMRRKSSRRGDRYISKA